MLISRDASRNLIRKKSRPAAALFFAAIHSQDKEDGRKAATKNRAAEKLLHGGGILPPVIFVDGIPTEIGIAERPEWLELFY